MVKRNAINTTGAGSGNVGGFGADNVAGETTYLFHVK
jgi:hypothetical protein